MTDAVAIAVSGGVDSMVAAHLLKKQGHHVLGLHFLTGYEKSNHSDSNPVRNIGRQLAIPVTVVDLKPLFQSVVVDYFAAAYQAGETPNPCLVCNPAIKFGILLEEAFKRGARCLATGHYARVVEAAHGHFRLFKGVDAKKDQSYFLSRLSQHQLAHALFPLGTLTKDQVRAIAAENGLIPVSREESQDVCFIKGSSYADFLVQTAGISYQPGDIVDTAGRRVGTHNGLHRYTVGQRRGINCPASSAYYVVRIDTRHNRLVVGFKDELVAAGCRVREINWIDGVPDGPMTVDTRIRYRHRAVASTVMPDGPDCADVRFEQPQSAVTPGQGAVFYRGDEVIGGGWIV